VQVETQKRVLPLVNTVVIFLCAQRFILDSPHFAVISETQLWRDLYTLSALNLVAQLVKAGGSCTIASTLNFNGIIEPSNLGVSEVQFLTDRRRYKHKSDLPLLTISTKQELNDKSRTS
jgi:hypothetical protein